MDIDALVLSGLEWLSRPVFYSELALLVAATFLAQVFSATIKRHLPILRDEPESGPILALRKNIYALRVLVFPLFAILALSISNEISLVWLGDNSLTRVAQGLPIAALHVFGLLGETVTLLDRIALQVGNIRITATGVFRVLIFGSIIFWLGRLSSHVGTQVIRSQEAIDLGTREVAAKLFQVGLYMLVFVLVLQVMGVNLTALAVFGGALGVGLGFGLQAIASNFISGIIILLDRSIAVGDYIELADGRTGTIRELNMRSTLLETFDGKDIMVPNEQFITTSFVNWTHKDKRQRYSLYFSVAYDTDVRSCVKLVREVVRSHPQVMSGNDLPFEFQPDCEINSFQDSGIEMLVEWWMLGIDDGENRVGGDLYLMILEALRANNIVIPFPQRDLRILTGAV